VLGPPKAALALAKRLMSGIAHITGTLAFRAARDLPPGRAAGAAEWLGNRCAAWIAHERHMLHKGERLPDGAYSTAPGVTASPYGRADLAVQLYRNGKITGTSVALSDLSFPHVGTAGLGLKEIPGPHHKVPARRVREAARAAAAASQAAGPAA
jgi:hypothetical protein